MKNETENRRDEKDRYHGWSRFCDFIGEYLSDEFEEGLNNLFLNEGHL